eukprot:2146778-Rhodomonas_salina.1
MAGSYNVTTVLKPPGGYNKIWEFENWFWDCMRSWDVIPPQDQPRSIIAARYNELQTTLATVTVDTSAGDWPAIWGKLRSDMVFALIALFLRFPEIYISLVQGMKSMQVHLDDLGIFIERLGSAIKTIEKESIGADKEAHRLMNIYLDSHIAFVESMVEFAERGGLPLPSTDSIRPLLSHAKAVSFKQSALSGLHAGGVGGQSEEDDGGKEVVDEEGGRGEKFLMLTIVLWEWAV